MKRFIAFVMGIVMLITQCRIGFLANAESDASVEPVFERLNDPAFLQYLEDSAYAYLEANIEGEDYIIEDIGAIYISQEYIDEVAYNTKANVYFGYTLAELNEAFEGRRYIFTLGGEGQTTVQEFEAFPDNTNAILLRNIAVGTGVILLCITVSVITAGMAPAGAGAALATASSVQKISMIFVAAANSATKAALIGSAIGAASSAVIVGTQTEDLYETIQAMKVSASEGFKMGAICGAISGGVQEGIRIHRASTGVPTWKEAEKRALEKYGGQTQKSYLDGEEVYQFTPGATRPDLITEIDGKLVAVEVKNYDLVNDLYGLKRSLLKEIQARSIHLPNGMEQMIALNVEGRGYTQVFVDMVKTELKQSLWQVYPDIPIDIMGAVL